MTAMLLDTSVLLKWFDERDEAEVPQAWALRDAHVEDKYDARVLDLAIYELSNALLRRKGWPADQIADSIEDLIALIGHVVPVSTTWARDGFHLAEQHRMSAYDGCWAAAARHLHVPLVSADQQLLRAGLAESPTQAAIRLELLP